MLDQSKCKDIMEGAVEMVDSEPIDEVLYSTVDMVSGVNNANYCRLSSCIIY